MKPSTHAIAAALAVILPTHMLWFLTDGAAMAALLVYVGIALPAVWSENPARRKAAAAVLNQILNACTGADRRETTSQTSGAGNARSSSANLAS
jgi:hypothetical protein